MGDTGFGMCFSDENGKAVYQLWMQDGSFVTLQKDGTYRKLCAYPSNYKTDNIKVSVKLDFETGKSLTVITYDADGKVLTEKKFLITEDRAVIGVSEGTSVVSAKVFTNGGIVTFNRVISTEK